ncbi:D-Ala-D-Ala carboxypeptidase family metallohydrolase [Rhizobium sp. MC63]|uniref:D-Ala-D-Ala carboxypeptidase family metallohydrolase n=1 Tax=Rhizobium mulingense TaxID=3031128 RepID=A0ACC6N5F5_9HYPH|nr:MULTISPECIES: D-Ala-D-Ala carboxypeptidase family metallohydrolase [unclassified Rhizobium]MDF0697935.1 D-Ala-D-Ala carboxypeptidase family metallohydrolase [Rhizobium sp. MC63]MEA3520637.1 D-Ala-D-Ala carboxypeptidase family metallohydrolase [Rhizobium sp. MJ31]
MRNNEMRMPVTGALLIATSLLALSGCASNKKALDSAAALPVAPATAAAEPQLGATAPAKSAPRHTDPRLVNVSGAQATPQGMAPDPNAAVPPADPAMAAPANIGGLVMQSTRINAQAMSIFSDHQPPPQNNSTSTIIQPQAYAPTQGVAPTRSSVYSQPAVPAQQAAPVLPQQSSENSGTQPLPVQTASLATGGIPAITTNALYSAPKQNLLGSLSGLLHKAALPGMTRVAPNGLHVQNDHVEVGCFKPDLLKVIKTVENHFGRPVIVTSGYRDEEHNRLVGGADESMHKSCEAADIQIDGVSKWDIAAYIRSLPDRGGVGTYCHTDSVHLDTGKSRDWNWGCGGKRAPMTTARAI